MRGNTFLERYIIEGKIGESRGSIVYKALDSLEDGRPVALKVLKSGNVSRRPDDIIRFQAEADAVSRLSHPRICRVYGCGEHDGLHYIVMEYVEGVTLRDFMKDCPGDDFALFTDIIIGICEALDHVHRKNLIHRDLKPSNVLVRPRNVKELKLIDFGLARMKNADPGGADEMAGTLHYISPEQTGLLRKNTDERSDLYSLGVIFYELIARKPPFAGPRLSTLVHQHIARRPELLTRVMKNVPPILDKIVLKLLEKEPDDRYQRALGLLSDLRKYRSGATDFNLGMEDKALKLHYRTRLTGREKELDALASALSGNGSFIFIAGEAGIGKSRLVEELRESVSEKGMTFLDAKCFLSENKTPYGPFQEILGGYVKDFICYTDAEKASIREELKESLQDSGGIVLRLNPRMREVIGDAPPLVALEPDREHLRFIRLAARFFLDLGRIENGLVLFLDDLQWMDEGSFEVLNEIAGSIAEHPLFIIGAYRDNEITAEHGVSRFREACAARKFPLREIPLGCFTPRTMNTFISGLLFDTEDNVRSISDFVFQKSHGNPFFALEIAKQMIGEKAIAREDGSWKIARDVLESIEIPTNIVDILVKRISLLAEKETAVLSYAAVIGKVFDIGLLFELVKEAARREIVDIVEKAKDLQLLEEDAQVKGRLLFVHDRVRDAFHIRIGMEKRKALHNAVGMALEKAGADGCGGAVFDLAGHFIEAGNAEKTIAHAFPAGMRAKENFANAEAMRYLTIVKELLENNGMGKSAQWVQCVDALCDVCLLAARNDEVIGLSAQMLPLLCDDMEKAKVHMRISRAYLKKWDYQKCEEYVKSGLELLGERYPTRTWRIVLSIFKEFLVHAVHTRFPRAPSARIRNGREAEKCKMIIWHYYSLGTIYVMSNILAYVRLIYRTLNLSESRIGPSRELVLALTAYATVLTTIPLFRKARLYNQRALDMSRRINDAWGTAKCHQYFGFIHQWKAEFGASIDHLKESLDILNRIGDIKEAAYSLDLLKTSHIYLSDYENAKRVNGEYYGISKDCDDYYGIGDSLADSITIGCETGNIARAEECLRESESIDEKYKTSHARFREHVGAGLLARAKEDTRGALECLEKARIEYEKNSLMEQYTCFIYSYLLDASIADLDAPDGDGRREKNIGIMKRYARAALRKTRPWLTHYGAAQIVHAKYCAVRGRRRKAERWFLRGIACSKGTGRKFDEGVGYCEYGVFLNGLKREKEAASYWVKAYRIFAELGAGSFLGKAKSLLRLGDEEEDSLRRAVQIAKNKQMSSDILGLMRDMMGPGTLEETADGVMDAILEITGSQRSCLIRRNPRTGDLEIVAGRSADHGAVAFDSLSLSVIFSALDRGETVLTCNVKDDPVVSRHHSIIKYGIQGVLCFPVRYRGNVIGACYCDSQTPSLAAEREGIETLSVAIAQFILAFEGASPRRKGGKLAIDRGQFESACREYGLTKREMEILLSTVNGLTNREICGHFDISKNTLRTHLKKIHGKTGASDRDGLIDLFMKMRADA